MTFGDLWRRLRSQMPGESTIDLDLHTDRIADEVVRVRMEKEMNIPTLAEHNGDLIPATDKFFRRPVYERFLRRRHHMPLDPPTDLEKSDAIKILRDEQLWSDEIYEEAELIFKEAGIEYSRE